MKSSPNDLSTSDNYFLIINDGEKDVSSRDGMKRTVETSSFYQGWLDNVEKDLSQVHEAIKTKDFPRLGEIIEANGLRMHGTTLGAVPPFTYWSPGSLQAMALVRQARAKGIPCYFTMDAGPNVKVLVEKKNLEALKTFLSEHFSKEQLVPAFAGPGIELIFSQLPQNFYVFEYYFQKTSLLQNIDVLLGAILPPV